MGQAFVYVAGPPAGEARRSTGRPRAARACFRPRAPPACCFAAHRIIGPLGLVPNGDRRRGRRLRRGRGPRAGGRREHGEQEREPRRHGVPAGVFGARACGTRGRVAPAQGARAAQGSRGVLGGVPYSYCYEAQWVATGLARLRASAGWDRAARPGSGPPRPGSARAAAAVSAWLDRAAARAAARWWHCGLSWHHQWRLWCSIIFGSPRDRAEGGGKRDSNYTRWSLRRRASRRELGRVRNDVFPFDAQGMAIRAAREVHHGTRAPPWPRPKPVWRREPAAVIGSRLRSRPRPQSCFACSRRRQRAGKQAARPKQVCSSLRTAGCQ